MSIIAFAMIVSVGLYGVVVEILARGGTITHAFPGRADIGHAALAVGVVMAIVARVVHRAMLARGPADPGARIQTASIVSFALAEAPAVLGLVVFMLTGLRQAAYPLLVVSLVTLAVGFPRWSQWEESAREIERAAPRSAPR